MGKEQSKDARVGEVHWQNQHLQSFTAEQVINQAREQGIHLESIEVLNVSHNELTELSAGSVEHFPALRVLDGSRNKLHQWHISKPLHLTRVDLSFNRFQQLPPSLGSLRRLQSLILSHNILLSLSDELQHLQHLTFLDLSHNQIRTLPASLGKLSALETLYLRDNEITSDGCQLGELYSLRMADLSGNQLTTLPDVTFLASLVKLYLNDNRLTSLPPTIAYLPKLRELSLRKNQLSTLPPEMNDLVCLTLLDVEDNRFPVSAREVVQTCQVSLILRYLHGNHTEKQKAQAEAKRLASEQPGLASHQGQGSGHSVQLTLSDAGIGARSLHQEPATVTGYTKRLFLVKGTEALMIVEKKPVHHSSMNVGDCFILDAGKKVFVWQGAESNALEKAKAEHWAGLLTQELGGAELILLDAGRCEDSPLLPEGFDFWNQLGGKGHVQEATAGGSDDTYPPQLLLKRAFFSIIENDANRRCTVKDMTPSDPGQLSKEMLNSSHCFVLDAWSDIFVWAGTQSSMNEKSYALLKAEELERQAGRPACVSVAWMLDGDEMLAFRECFPDWQDDTWKSLLKHTVHQKAKEVAVPEDYDKVLTKQIRQEEKRLARGERYSTAKQKKLAQSSGTMKRLSRHISSLKDVSKNKPSHESPASPSLEKVATPATSPDPVVEKKPLEKEEPVMPTPAPEPEPIVVTKEEPTPTPTVTPTPTTPSSPVVKQKPSRKVKIPAAFAETSPASTSTEKKPKKEASPSPQRAPSTPEPEPEPQPIKKEPEPEPVEHQAPEPEEKKSSTRLARLKSPLKGPSRKARATKNPVKDRARIEKEDEKHRAEAEQAQAQRVSAQRNAAAGAYGMLWALGVDASLFEKRMAQREKAAKEPKDPNTKPPHIYHLKGRRRIFIREVEVTYRSLNSGDVFIIDTGERVLYQWNGSKANRIEKGSALDFAKKLKDKYYFGNARIVTLEEGKTDASVEAIWKVLGQGPIKSAAEGGDDEEASKLFRECVKLFRVAPTPESAEPAELVLVGDGPYPKELLESSECFIMDCMTEIYPWTGKKANLKLRQWTLKKAQAMAEERPFWVAEVERQLEGGESVLFKERFSNWSSGLPITVAQVAVGTNTAKVTLSGQVDVAPLHTRREKKEEVMIDDGTGEVKVWQIVGFEKVLLPPERNGFFYSGESYIVLYKYIWKNKDCFIIYYYQGRDSTVNEKGTSAVLTIELDKEISGMAKEIRVVQYKESKHFLLLFANSIVLHAGKSAQATNPSTAALYHIRSYSQGIYAVQCHCRAESLNPTNTFVLVHGTTIYVWVGRFSPEAERDFAMKSKLLAERSVQQVAQGQEPAAFWKALGGQRAYPYQKETARAPVPRLFHCSVGTGTFGITEVVDFCQDDLSTHDTFVVDAVAEVFVWFGRRSAEKEQRWTMEAAIRYVETSPVQRGAQPTPVWVVREEAEPYRFTTHFQSWMHKRHTEQKSGLDGGLEDVRALLQQFSRTYTYEELISGQFSKALDTANIERYLSDEEFGTVFKMTREEFDAMPGWKRTDLKKSLQLF